LEKSFIGFISIRSLDLIVLRSKMKCLFLLSLVLFVVTTFSQDVPYLRSKEGAEISVASGSNGPSRSPARKHTPRPSRSPTPKRTPNPTLDPLSQLQHEVAKLQTQVAALQLQVPPGTIIAFAGLSDKIPAGWLLCDGHEVPKELYSKLYVVIGDQFDVASSSSFFKLPNLSGRVIIGSTAAKTVYGGSESVEFQITEANMPPHDHSGHTSTGNPMFYRLVNPHNPDTGIPSTAANHIDGWYGGAFVDHTDDQYPGSVHTHSVPAQGGGQPVSVQTMMPFTNVPYIIKF
jgi:microcystin-dependent protein